MKNQKHEGFKIDCVVAMPEGETKPSYNGECIRIGEDDYLELHYMGLTNIDHDDVIFNTSMDS